MLLYVRDTFELDAHVGHMTLDDEAAVEDAALAEGCMQAVFQHGCLRWAAVDCCVCGVVEKIEGI